VLELVAQIFVIAFVAVTVYGHVLLFQALLIDIHARHRGGRYDEAKRCLSRLLRARQPHSRLARCGRRISAPGP
jgi:hypothetical protein